MILTLTMLGILLMIIFSFLHFSVFFTFAVCMGLGVGAWFGIMNFQPQLRPNSNIILGALLGMHTLHIASDPLTLSSRSALPCIIDPSLYHTSLCHLNNIPNSICSFTYMLSVFFFFIAARWISADDSHVIWAYAYVQERRAEEGRSEKIVVMGRRRRE